MCGVRKEKKQDCLSSKWLGKSCDLFIRLSRFSVGRCRTTKDSSSWGAQAFLSTKWDPKRPKLTGQVVIERDPGLEVVQLASNAPLFAELKQGKLISEEAYEACCDRWVVTFLKSQPPRSARNSSFSEWMSFLRLASHILRIGQHDHWMSPRPKGKLSLAPLSQLAAKYRQGGLGSQLNSLAFWSTVPRPWVPGWWRSWPCPRVGSLGPWPLCLGEGGGLGQFVNRGFLGENRENSGE